MTNSTGTGSVAALRESLPPSASRQDLIAALQATLRERKDYHRLFDARMIEARDRLGLPVTQPTSLDNIPKQHEQAIRDAYIEAAREVGTLFLNDGRLSDAWAYFRTIGEPQPVRDAIEKVRIPREPDDAFEEVMNVALYEGAHISRGLEFLLKTHGTCNTVTAFSQLQQQMTPEERRRSGAMMVRTIYDDLQAGIRRQVESRMPILSPNASLRELMAGRDWLFDDGNYHIDVSHLHSTVAFARALQREDPELKQAVELCEYGQKLAPHLQYPSEVPFDDYYRANHFFLNALAGEDEDAALQYFLKRLQDEPDLPDQRLIAFVLLDLAQRLGRTPEILERTAPLVSRMQDQGGFSFTQLCVELGQYETLEETAEENDDVLSYAISRLSRPTDGTAETN
ncbi:MAG: hypothetical protein KDA81_22080 [Planctomycetaceae bacterium]|nr:hypothetical protein [Planctomycetaceae bacterium]